MTEEFQSKVRKMILKGEGSIPHMYLDTRSKVTVGVGNLLPSADSACNLPFVNRGTNKPATEAEIRRDFESVEGQPGGLRADKYRPFTELALPREAIERLLDKRLEKFIERLRADFPDFDGYPEPARLGLIDMAFNLGNQGLIDKFPTFTGAARSRDWAICARECRRQGIGDSRNEETRHLFLECLAPES